MSDTQRQAVAALLGDDETHNLTLEPVITHLTARYLSHVKRAPELKEKGASVKDRLFYARALEVASILTDLHKQLGSSDTLWEQRRKYCEARAFNHKNQLAENIGAGPDTSVIASLEDPA